MLTHSKEIIIKGIRDYYQADIVQALKDVGVEEGNDIFVHSNISFGEPDPKVSFGDPGETLNIASYCNAIIECFLEAVGNEGTVMMPTYTYSFFEGEKYSPSNSISKVGVITEIFRRRKDAKRSLHPILSISAIGKKAKYYTKIDDKTSFGSKSFFAKLPRNNVKIVLFGAPLSSIVFIHFLEQSIEVPYYRKKKFSGKIISENGEYKDTFEYFITPSDGSVMYDFFKLEEFLVAEDVMKRMPFGRSWVKSIASKKFYKECIKKLRKDPRFLLKSFW